MDDKTNSLEKEDLVEMVRELAKKVRQLEAEILRIRKLLQE